VRGRERRPFQGKGLSGEGRRRVRWVSSPYFRGSVQKENQTRSQEERGSCKFRSRHKGEQPNTRDLGLMAENLVLSRRGRGSSGGASGQKMGGGVCRVET